MSDKIRGLGTSTPDGEEVDTVRTLSRRDMVKMTAGAGAYIALNGCSMPEGGSAADRALAGFPRLSFTATTKSQSKFLIRKPGAPVRHRLFTCIRADVPRAGFVATRSYPGMLV